MKNLRNVALAGAGLASVGVNTVMAGGAGVSTSTGLKVNQVGADTIASTVPIETVVQQYIYFFLGFLYLIAVVYGLWGGFNILTAGGDDDKVSKGKKIIINALIGVVVIFFVGQIVGFLFRALGVAVA